MDDKNTLERLHQVVAKRRETEPEASARNYQDASKKRLFRILEKKLQTSFIGALSQFENLFGKLWGHGKDEMECTADELEWRALWNLCRTEVLTNGNNQLRAVQAELAQYTITWNRFQVDMPAAKPVVSVRKEGPKNA